MKRLVITLAALVVLLSASRGLALTPQTADESSAAPAFTVGVREYLDSKVLGERREILVSVPPAVPPGVKLPLLVVLDAERQFRLAVFVTENLRWCNRLPPIVVAGVVNTHRGRDMLPGFDGDEFTAADSAGRFLTFLADELPSFLAERHAVGDYRILRGHSNAGAFVLQALARRPDAFQAYLATSPSSGDDRLQRLLARTLSRPGLGPRFLFLGVGDEEGDIALGATRFAKTIEGSLPASLAYHYAYFPGENHCSVVLPSLLRGLQLLGEPEPRATAGPARYLSEAQLRERAWIRRFGAGYHVGASPGAALPLLSAVRPLMDQLSQGGPDDLSALWEELREDYADVFRFDPVDSQNLLAYLEASGRSAEASALRALPGFVTEVPGASLNNYGEGVDLEAGLAAHVAMDGGPHDLVGTSTRVEVKGAVPSADRRGHEGGAYSFDGKGSFIEITGNPGLEADGSLTVSAWIRPRTPAAYTAWVCQPRSVGWGSKWRLGFGTAGAEQWGATTLTTRWTDYWTKRAAVPVGKWVHTAAVFDQTLGSITLYLDGQPVEELWGLMPWSASTGPLLIGAQRDDGLFFDGDVGEVRVYNRTLSAAEIAALHASE
jgi:predicted alpha/beta superfamily hydrolase